MDAKIEDLQKNLDKNLIFSSVYSDPFGRLANILSRFWELFSALFHLFDYNAGSQLVWMAQKVICVHSTWLWKEKKSSHHICDANYAVRGPRKPVAHLLLPEKSFRRTGIFSAVEMTRGCYLWASFHDIWPLSKSSRLDI